MSESLISGILSYHKVNSLNKKTALITGASSGIGLATSVYLAKEGANLILVARREKQLLQLQKEIKENFPKVRVDILSLDITKKNATQYLQHFNALDVDIFINNAGLVRTKDFVMDALEEDIDEVLETNLSSAFKISASIAKNMVKNGHGHIVHIGSIAGLYPYEGGAIYCATKSALRAFSQSMRQELYDKNVRVSYIAPGIVETDFSLVRFKGDSKKAEQVYAGLNCLQAPDIARQIIHVLKEPSHVNLDEVVILPTEQAPLSNKTKRKL